MDDYTKFTETEFEKAYSIFYKELTRGMSPTENPRAYILGGQSGAGKSTIHKIIAKKDPNTIVIDGDRFRERHPHFEKIQEIHKSEAANYTQAFSNKMVNEFIERLSNEKFNLIIEGTCRTSRVPLETCAKMKAKGYFTELDVICVDKMTSWDTTIERYNSMKQRKLDARAVPVEKYLEIIQSLPNSISEICEAKTFDEICLYDRDKKCLYKLSESPYIDPADIVRDKLNVSPVSLEELKTKAENDIKEIL